MARRAMLRQAQKRNDERQQDIVNDTAKLLKLTQQLKDELAKNKDPMSMATIKKTEEIEKLARSVKDKMKGN